MNRPEVTGEWGGFDGCEVCGTDPVQVARVIIKTTYETLDILYCQACLAHFAHQMGLVLGKLGANPSTETAAQP